MTITTSQLRAMGREVVNGRAVQTQSLTPRKPRHHGKVGIRKSRFSAALASCESGPGWLKAVVPIWTTTESNAKGHWRTKAQRAAKQIAAVGMVIPKHKLPPLPVRVTLSRIAPGILDGHDNHASALKHLVDGIARMYGADDGRSGMFEWVYGEQEKGDYAVRILIQHKEEVKHGA